MNLQEVSSTERNHGGFMTTTSKNSKNTNTVKNNVKDVLFQKIGNKWFIFSEVNNEVVYSVMPEGMDPKSTKLELYEIIEEHMSKVASHKRRSPEAVA
jgi:hypothetical protein